MFDWINKKKIKISIITWDACFRESYHTIDSFGSQLYPADRYEFIWVDYYCNSNKLLQKKIESKCNFKILNLNHSTETAWHLGICINKAISVAHGDILVIPDGDIIVPNYLLEEVETEHKHVDNKVVYYRRWDEDAQNHSVVHSYDIRHLEKVCRLHNPTNYGGLITIKKKALLAVNGCEESEVFSGPGANGLELYTRLRNAGYPIKWSRTKIFHPYHENTGFSNTNRSLMELLSKKHPWLNTYAGPEQSWVIKSRELNLDYLASRDAVSNYLKNMPSLFDS